jgi:hypothetical protein
MHCRECRFSEGQAEEAGGRTALRLYCMAKGGRALEVCENFAPMVHEARDAYEMTDQLADVLEGRR